VLVKEVEHKVRDYVSVAGCLGYDVLVTSVWGLGHASVFQLLVV
jgi:hypothetical protein